MQLQEGFCQRACKSGHLAHGEGHGDHAVGPRLAVQAADEVGQVVQHCQVVLHRHHILAGIQQAPDHLRTSRLPNMRPWLGSGTGGPGSEERSVILSTWAYCFDKLCARSCGRSRLQASGMPGRA